MQVQGPYNFYRDKVKAGDLRPDPEQDKAAAALQTLYDGLTKGRRKGFFGFGKSFGQSGAVPGVYMYGGVGRGKSMLMDLLMDTLPETVRARRVHFHDFMIETHDWLHQKRGQKAVDNLLPAYAAKVAKELRLLCFDEFHVTNVVDAMILSRLFTVLFDKGVSVVATSNWPPDRLYEGGLQRERFLPFIDLLKTQTAIVHLDSDTDYRTRAVQDIETYFWPLNRVTQEKADDLFAGLTDGAAPETQTLTVKGRAIDIQATRGIARCHFSQLCEQPHAAEDYIKVAEAFHTVFLEGVPKMGYDRRNEVKRLMLLIDVLYDRGIRAVITADAPPGKLYYGHDHAFEFERTVSRLMEMQSSGYFEK